VDAPRRGFGNAVDRVCSLPSHSDFDHTWVVFNEFAHRLPSQTPHARQIANSVMLLKGVVRLRQGLDPRTSDFLRVRHSADRTAVDGTKLAQGRSLYDFTISAPKSVSVLAILGGDDRLIEAHRTAVAETLEEAEMYAASRVRQGGANKDRPTANLALAVYHHDASRELDPQLHTHAVAANLTYDGTEGRWKALQASEIYERRAYLSEVHRNALAREVRALGHRRGYDQHRSPLRAFAPGKWFESRSGNPQAWR
jgi:hypothetical protein